MAPFVPADVDLRDFAYMPLDVQRLRDAEFTATVKPEEFRAGLLLWCAAWHQVPAGSLPGDDVQLAKLAGYGYAVKEWKKVKAGALYGWCKCSDGLLHHKIVAEKVLDSWESKLKHSHERYVDRGRKQNKARKESNQPELPIIGFDEWKAAGRPDDIRQNTPPKPPETIPIPPETKTGSAGIPTVKALNRSEGKGREYKGEGEVKVLPPTAPEPLNPKPSAEGVKKRPRPAAKDPGRTVATGAAYAMAYEQRYGVRPTFNRTVNGHLAAFVDRIGEEESPAVASHFLLSNRSLYLAAKHATNLLVRDAEALRTEWATNRHGTDTEARTQDGTAARGNVWGTLLQEARNGTER